MGLHLIFRKSGVEPCFQLCRQEAKNQVKRIPNELRCRLADARRPSGLPTKVVVQVHIICICNCGIIDLEEVAQESMFLVDKVRHLLKGVSKRLDV